MKYAAPVIACALFLGGAAQARDSLGVFERWGAFRDAKIPRCYAISEPVKDNHQSRWRPFAAVGYWPKKSVHGQMHFRLSRSEEHTSELQSLMRISYAVFCLKKKKKKRKLH